MDIATCTAAKRFWPQGLAVEELSFADQRVTVNAKTSTKYAACPLCRSPSARIHSRYIRTVADLPRHGVTVSLRVHVRRFFCNNLRCKRAIFCERLPEIVSYARKTGRLEEALLLIAFELGGEAGARLACDLGLRVSPGTLLNRIRKAPRPSTKGIRVLGVDDFAFKKGHSYGTILVDLERRRVVDLLPDRSQESLLDWLKAHPEVEVATRDRSHIYREGLSKGSPNAMQVTDRWHLLHNLASVLEESLLQKRPELRKAAMPEASPEEKDTDDFAPGTMTPNRPRKHAARIEEAARKRHERLVEQWQDIRRLYLAGADVRLISQKLGIRACADRRVANVPMVREKPV